VFSGPLATYLKPSALIREIIAGLERPCKGGRGGGAVAKAVKKGNRVLADDGTDGYNVLCRPGIISLAVPPRPSAVGCAQIKKNCSLLPGCFCD
jgi:hypothetical protein